MLSLSSISRRAACAIFGVLACSSLAFTERLPIRTYTVADGLLRDAVSRIRMDSRGFLWFCSVEGVSRFDGEGFTSFRVEDGLPDRHVNDILETKSGDYLIATDKGIALFDPTGSPGSNDHPLFTAFAPDEPDAQAITTLFQDSLDRIWAGTPNGLFKVTKKDSQFVFERLPVEKFGVVAIIQDRRGAILAAGERQGQGTALLVRIGSDGSVDTFSTESGLPRSQIDALLETTDGRILAGLRPGEKELGLLQIRDDGRPGEAIVERAWTTRDGLPTYWLPALYQSSDGKLWLGTTDGVCLWQGDGQSQDRGSVCRTFTAKNDMCDREVMSFVEDKDGNLWIGTGCGVKRLARYGFTIFDERDHLDTPFVSSIFETTSGDIFLNTRRGRFSLSRFEGSTFQTKSLRVPAGVYLGWGWKQVCWQDTDGVWWVPTGDGLFKSPPNTSYEKLDQARLDLVPIGNKKSVFRLYEDSRHDIWVATVGNGSGELLRWTRSDARWEDLTEKAGFSPGTIGSVFVEDKSGNLWIATGSDSGDGRLIRYRDEHFQTFTDGDGAPAGWTRDAYVDDSGRLWLANTAAGLIRIDDVNSNELKLKKYTFAEGLSSTAVYCVTSDAIGRIYAGTGRGLDRLQPETGTIEHFTTADGLPSSYIELAFRDRNNVLWFGTSEGVVRYQPEPATTRKSPRVLLTYLQTGTRTRPVSLLGETEIEHLDLASDENQVRVQFIGLGASLGEKLKFEYRLGDSSAWQPTPERIVNFANLGPGSYRFEVRAVSVDRLYSDPAVISFNVAAPIWQRWWFILFVSLVVATIVYLFYRTRLQRLLELERVRTRIATDLHDDIGANLTRISILSEVARQKSTNGNGLMLSSIAEIARESVASMNDIVWAISPKHDSLADLVTRMRRHAEEVFSIRDVKLDFDAPQSDRAIRLGVGARRNLLLIYKEAVNNAAKHASCSAVQIEMKIVGPKLKMRVADNGRAFDISEVDGSGLGLESMQRRSDGIGAELTLSSINGEGTSVVLEVPLSHIDQS